MKPYYLYKITNKANQKIYIGITSRPRDRMREHLSKNSTCTKLRRVVEKYGKDSFEMEILCVGTEEYIQDLEEKALVAYNCIDGGYNILGSHPNKLGVSMPESSRKAMSASLLKFYRENPNYLKENRKPRVKIPVPVYVSGFWFDSKDRAIEMLCINEKTFYKRRLNGSLGDTCIPQKKSIIYKPHYLLGIWFPTLLHASTALSKPIDFLQHLIRNGDLEQSLTRVGTKPRSEESSGLIGVNRRESGNYRATLIFNKKKLLSKTFKTKEEAALAYDDCYESIHGQRPNSTTRENP